MPAVATLLSDRPHSGMSKAVEDQPLFLPSALTEELRTQGCTSGLALLEIALLEAQCLDTLDSIRSIAHCKWDSYHFHNSHMWGQGPLTRAASFLEKLDQRQEHVVGKYQDRRVALLRLWGPGE